VCILLRTGHEEDARKACAEPKSHRRSNQSSSQRRAQVAVPISSAFMHLADTVIPDARVCPPACSMRECS
jgi:hypothetical protein